MGLNYGPIVVARNAETDIRDAQVAIPGEHTTAYLLGRIFMDPFQPVEMAFSEVLPAVRDGSVTAGIVIHEGQLNFAEYGLTKRVDLGERWFAATGLPLPLGLNVVRRGLGETRQRALAAGLSASIAWADAHPEPALAYARSFAPEVDADLTAEFTRMYVNDLTRDMGGQGAAGLEALYRRAVTAGLLDEVPPLDILRI